ncbi:hypothetical protein [Ascidiaceihabitans sp.]|uniref:hypothetical protein n=1 Tax=Ascidiaceihabitans sp. TaxID=1872644 RepID=UPI003299B99B
MKVSEKTDQVAVDAFLLATADLLHTPARAFERMMRDQLSNVNLSPAGTTALDRGIANGSFKSLESAKNMLMQPLAQDSMFLIWKSSAFLCDEGLEMAGLARPNQSAELNKNQLVKMVSKGIDSSEGVVQRVSISVSRYLLAMEVFELVRVDKVRTNLLNIVAQPNLDELLRASLSAAGEIFSDQLIGERGNDA